MEELRIKLTCGAEVWYDKKLNEILAYSPNKYGVLVNIRERQIRSDGESIPFNSRHKDSARDISLVGLKIPDIESLILFLNKVKDIRIDKVKDIRIAKQRPTLDGKGPR